MASYLQDNQIGKFVMPFLNIGYHVVSEGVERSPLGLLGTGIDVAKGLAGQGVYAKGFEGTAAVGPAAERARNGLMGTGLAFAAWNQAGQGNITGNAPDDPKEKADLMAQGWQPDSIRMGGRYFDLHTLGPVAWPLAMAANLYESTNTSDSGGYMKPGTGGGEQFARSCQVERGSAISLV